MKTIIAVWEIACWVWAGDALAHHRFYTVLFTIVIGVMLRVFNK